MHAFNSSLCSQWGICLFIKIPSLPFLINPLYIIQVIPHLRGDGGLSLLSITGKDLLLTFALGAGRSRSLEGLLKVGNDVVNVLDTDGNSDEVLDIMLTLLIN